MEHIDTKLVNESPLAFGLHPNAAIVPNSRVGAELLASLLSCGQLGAGGLRAMAGTKEGEEEDGKTTGGLSGIEGAAAVAAVAEVRAG